MHIQPYFFELTDYASSINNPEILKPGDATTIELDLMHAPVDSMVSPSNYFETANDYNKNEDYDENENEEYYNDYERFLVDYYTDTGNYIENNGNEWNISRL